MSEDSVKGRPKKERNRKGHSIEDLGLPSEVREIFEAAVKEAAGTPLSMAAGSPLGQVIGAFVEHCLKEELNEHLGHQPHLGYQPRRRRHRRAGRTRATVIHRSS